MFRRNILPPYSGQKMEGVYSWLKMKGVYSGLKMVAENSS
jgi:hypothetical protein